MSEPGKKTPIGDELMETQSEGAALETAILNADQVDVGTAEDVEEIMKKYDNESNTRIWEGCTASM